MNIFFVSNINITVLDKWNEILTYELADLDFNSFYQQGLETVYYYYCAFKPDRYMVSEDYLRIQDPNNKSQQIGNDEINENIIRIL